MKKDSHLLLVRGLKRVLPICCMTMILNTSCQNEDNVLPEEGIAKLKIVTEVVESTSRNAIMGNSLPDGTSIGVVMVDDDDEDYQGLGYNNVRYTAVTVDGSQKWEATNGVTLSGENATLYAYHPWKDNVDIEKISVDLAGSQDDWMYATKVTGLSNTNSTALIEMHHALSNMRITLVKGDFVGTGNVSKITLTSQGIASQATLNGKTGELSGIQQQGAALDCSVKGTISDEPLELNVLFVPTETEDTPIKVDITVDNKVYTITSPEVTTEAGTSINFTLIQNSVMLVMDGVTVTPWSPVPNQSLDADKKKG